MRLIINLCKYCKFQRESCNHYKNIKGAIGSLKKQKGTLIHNCPEYWKSVAIASHVEIELKEISLTDVYNDYPNAEWVSAGFAKGTIINRSGKSKDGFYVIELDEPATLCLPGQHDDKTWHKAENTKVTIRMKRAKDIKVIAGPPQPIEKEKEEIEEFF